MRYLYLHGFASGPDSKKGTDLANGFDAAGLRLERLDLNVPSFERLSPLAALERITDVAGRDRVVLLGSSMGGWLASIWAARRPEQVDRLVLLCPGFDLGSRWPVLLGPDAFLRWKEAGVYPFRESHGRDTTVHWAFVEEARTLPAWPEPPHPALVFHGERDDVVPIASSERWVARRPDRRLVRFDDDHALLGSLDRIREETLAFVR